MNTSSPSVSRSRSRLRPAALISRNNSSRSLLPQGGEELINPDGNIGVEAAHVLSEWVVPDNEEEERERREVEEREALLSAIEQDVEEERRHYRRLDNPPFEVWRQLPWYKRPSPFWLIGMVPLIAVAMSTTIAPRVQLYTRLACMSHKPEYMTTTDAYLNPGAGGGLEGTVWRFPKIGEPSQECMADPEVRAAVAGLMAALGTSMGILATFTTAFWTQLSDRQGRRLVMGLAVFGTLVGDLTFIFVSYFSKYLPGGYKFLLFGPIFDGLLGGMTTAIAVNHAYMADCVEPHARARYFSLSAGLLFSGMTVGPALGGLIIKSTGDLLSVFYFATSVHLLFGLIVWFIIPESLTKDKMAEARLRYKQVVTDVWWKKLFGFLRPMGLLIPKKIESTGSQGQKTTRRDWNLTCAALCMGLTSMIMPSYQFKFQYAQASFGWDAAQLGNWMSSVGAVRAAYLMIVFPLLIKFVKPKPPPHSAHPTASTPLIASEHAQHMHKSTQFDLRLARASLLIDITSYILLVIFASPVAFYACSMFGALGGGLNPSMQSVALELYVRRGESESGKLFGALSIGGAICAQIIGPTLFGVVYMSTVKSFPQSIFALCGTCLAIALSCNLAIKLRQKGDGEQQQRQG